jgi:hypothetical protein
MYTVEVYRLDVVNQTLSRIDVLTTFKALQFTRKLNNIGGLTLELDVHDKKATPINLQRWITQYAVRDGDKVRWWGPINKTSGMYTNLDGNITIEGSEYLAHFKNRYTDKLKQYDDTIDQQDIAWDLMNTSQLRDNGTLLVQRGSYSATHSRPDSYEYAEIADNVIDMANSVDGFDFTLDPVLDSDSLITHTLFNCYSPFKGTVRTDLPKIQFGVNCAKADFVTNTDLTNSGIVEGQGTGDVIKSELNYGASQTSYTRREVILSQKDIQVPSALSLYLNTYLNRDSIEGYAINLELMPDKTPRVDDFDLGDILTLDLVVEDSGGYLNFNVQARVIEISVSVDNLGVATIIPKLEILR